MRQAQLEPDVLDAATRAYSVAGCRDLARVDAHPEPAGLEVLEINTIAGLTVRADAPRGRCRGMSFQELTRDLRAGVPDIAR